MEWQPIDQRSCEQFNTDMMMVFRAKIHGGWLVRLNRELVVEDNNVISSSITFVPDPGHDWHEETI